MPTYAVEVNEGSWEIHLFSCYAANKTHRAWYVAAPEPAKVIERELKRNRSELIRKGYNHRDFKVMECCLSR